MRRRVCSCIGATCRLCTAAEAHRAKRKIEKAAAAALQKLTPCVDCSFPSRRLRCPACYGARAARQRAPRTGGPVAWSEWLTMIRTAIGDGACVAIFDGGRVSVDRVACERLVFESVESALEWATAPARVVEIVAP